MRLQLNSIRHQTFKYTQHEIDEIMSKEQVAQKLTATNKTVQHDRDDAGERKQRNDFKPASDGGIMKNIQTYSWYVQNLLWSKMNWINRKLS